MSVRTARALPVRIQFPGDEERSETWGRLLELRPDGGRLETRSRMRARESLLLWFELAGERFEELPARVLRAWTDEDGYRICELGFRGEGLEPLSRLLHRLSE